ncbi:cytochrome P450 4C1 isoform X2 [Monomorium pharaonis]|uniref:cytochrome P450 4C1 isoform X2 n=1 Tax=Monomorium pharaonis TaxID=307658 RepID=UPI0017465AE6|nr:cytochrome P450 4C1 isoform X2 [Monomorium pharaonis]
MFITILLLLVLIGYLTCHYYVQYGSNGRLINKIPGPPGYPIIGNVLLFTRIDSLEHLWKVYFNIIQQYYPFFKCWLFLIPVVGIRHPDDLEIILGSTKHINKSKLYDVLLPWFKTGLLVSKGSKWQLRRKMLAPTFHFNILQQYAEILIEEGERMTTSLKNIGNTVTKDLIPFIGVHTINAICETAMGISLKETDSIHQQYQKAILQIIDIFVYRVFRPWLRNDWIFSLTPKGREQTKVLKILHGFTEKIIAERKIYHKHYEQHKKNLSENSMAVAETTAIKKKRLAILDFLISASQEGLLTDSDIREEIDVFIAAAYDTTALAVSYTLALLAEHKDIQDCVRKEVDAIMRESQGKLTVQSLQCLQYLERCIKEALRLYPSAYFISRVTSEETQLKILIIGQIQKYLTQIDFYLKISEIVILTLIYHSVLDHVIVSGNDLLCWR